MTQTLQQAESRTPRPLNRWFLIVMTPVLIILGYLYIDVALKNTDTERAMTMVKNFSIDSSGHPSLEETISNTIAKNQPAIWSARKQSWILDRFEVRCTIPLESGEVIMNWEVGIVNRLLLPKNDDAAAIMEKMRKNEEQKP